MTNLYPPPNFLVKPRSRPFGQGSMARRPTFSQKSVEHSDPFGHGLAGGSATG